MSRIGLEAQECKVAGYWPASIWTFASETLLNAQGLIIHELLATAADIFTGIVDEERLVGWTDEHSARRASPVMEGVFHDNVGQNVDEIEADSVVWYEKGHRFDME